MQSSTSTIIAIIVLGGLLFIGPIITLTGRIDNVTQENAQLIVEEFVTDLANTGLFTREKYENLDSELENIGVDEIELLFYILDENPGKKTAQSNYEKIGENVYLIEFNTQLLPQIGIKVGNEEPSKEDTKILKPGDKIVVKARSTNPTANQTATSSILGFSNANESAISVSSEAMCTVKGMKN